MFVQRELGPREKPRGNSIPQDEWHLARVVQMLLQYCRGKLTPQFLQGRAVTHTVLQSANRGVTDVLARDIICGRRLTVQAFLIVRGQIRALHGVVDDAELASVMLCEVSGPTPVLYPLPVGYGCA